MLRGNKVTGHRAKAFDVSRRAHLPSLKLWHGRQSASTITPSVVSQPARKSCSWLDKRKQVPILLLPYNGFQQARAYLPTIRPQSRKGGRSVVLSQAKTSSVKAQSTDESANGPAGASRRTYLSGRSKAPNAATGVVTDIFLGCSPCLDECQQ